LAHVETILRVFAFLLLVVGVFGGHQVLLKKRVPPQTDRISRGQKMIPESHIVIRGDSHAGLLAFLYPDLTIDKAL
jgi:hypothetical protein